ncbi:hypothetical protein ACFSKN_15165, partial [Mariniflexile gromovii]
QTPTKTPSATHGSPPRQKTFVRNLLKTTQKKKKAQKKQKKPKKSIAEQEKGSMFAAAKNGSSRRGETFIDRLGIFGLGALKRAPKKNSKKISKNYCGIKKRVVGLQPLKTADVVGGKVLKIGFGF